MPQRTSRGLNLQTVSHVWSASMLGLSSFLSQQTGLILPDGLLQGTCQELNLLQQHAYIPPANMLARFTAG